MTAHFFELKLYNFQVTKLGVLKLEKYKIPKGSVNPIKTLDNFEMVPKRNDHSVAN